MKTKIANDRYHFKRIQNDVHILVTQNQNMDSSICFLNAFWELNLYKKKCVQHTNGFSSKNLSVFVSYIFLLHSILTYAHEYTLRAQSAVSARFGAIQFR